MELEDVVESGCAVVAGDTVKAEDIFKSEDEVVLIDIFNGGDKVGDIVDTNIVVEYGDTLELGDTVASEAIVVNEETVELRDIVEIGDTVESVIIGKLDCCVVSDRQYPVRKSTMLAS